MGRQCAFAAICRNITMILVAMGMAEMSWNERRCTIVKVAQPTLFPVS